MENEIRFGAYAVPIVLAALLGFIFKMVGDKVPDRFKSGIAVLAGIGLGILAIPYNSYDWSIVNIVDHTIYGFMMGCSAVGIYELQRSAIKPRE